MTGRKPTDHVLPLPVRRKMLEQAFARLAYQVLEDLEREEAEAKRKAEEEGAV